MTLNLKAIGTAAALAVSVPACSTSKGARPPATAATSSSSDDENALAFMEHHRFHHHGGVALFIALGLDALGVPEDRRAAVETIRNELLSNLVSVRLAEQTFIATLADGVAAGSIDAAAVDAAIVRLQAAAQAVFDRSADTLNRLHALLLPPERAALVGKVNAHWAVWQNVNAEEAGSIPREEGHLASLQAELGLTQFEVDRIREALTRQRPPAFDAKTIDAEIHAVDSAFVSDRFDAKALGAVDDANAHMVGWAARHLANFLQAATPSLTAEQRSALADKLRGHAAHNPSAEAIR
jgi:hypothetical protein